MAAHPRTGPNPGRSRVAPGKVSDAKAAGRWWPAVVLAASAAVLAAGCGDGGRSSVALQHPVVSENGSTAVAVAAAGGKRFVMSGESRVGDAYDEVSSPVVSPDGATVAFTARSGRERFVVVNGKRVVGDFRPVGAPVLTTRRDGVPGCSVAFVATKKGRYFIVKDGVRVSQEYDSLSGPVSSPTGVLAFVAVSGETRSVIRGGQLVAQYAGLGDMGEVRPPVFSPDGRSVAYVVRDAEGCYVARDGRRASDTFTEIGQPVFSPDGASLAFPAWADGKAFVVRDGVRLPGDYHAVNGLAFSPDGRSLAFAASTGLAWRVVRDGRRVGGDWRDVGGPLFSPDRRSLAFAAKPKNGRRWVLIKNGACLKGRYERVSPLTNSSDGARIVFAAVQGGRLRRVEIPW